MDNKTDCQGIAPDPVAYFDLPNVDLIDPIPDTKCRYPVGVWNDKIYPSDNKCCGRDIAAVPSSTTTVKYCAEHAKLAINPEQRKSSHLPKPLTVRRNFVERNNERPLR